MSAGRANRVRNENQITCIISGEKAAETIVRLEVRRPNAPSRREVEQHRAGMRDEEALAVPTTFRRSYSTPKLQPTTPHVAGDDSDWIAPLQTARRL